jgi:hypothetical protein
MTDWFSLRPALNSAAAVRLRPRAAVAVADVACRMRASSTACVDMTTDARIVPPAAVA